MYFSTFFALVRFRTISHKLSIETGRLNNIFGNQRLCNLYENVIGYDYHFIASI